MWQPKDVSILINSICIYYCDIFSLFQPADGEYESCLSLPVWPEVECTVFMALSTAQIKHRNSECVFKQIRLQPVLFEVNLITDMA